MAKSKPSPSPIDDIIQTTKKIRKMTRCLPDDHINIADVKKAMKSIHGATGSQPTGLTAHLQTFKEMGIDAEKDGEHLGGGVYYVRANIDGINRN